MSSGGMVAVGILQRPETLGLFLRALHSAHLSPRLCPSTTGCSSPPMSSTVVCLFQVVSSFLVMSSCQLLLCQPLELLLCPWLPLCAVHTARRNGFHCTEQEYTAIRSATRALSERSRYVEFWGLPKPPPPALPPPPPPPPPPRFKSTYL